MLCDKTWLNGDKGTESCSAIRHDVADACGTEYILNLNISWNGIDRAFVRDLQLFYRRALLMIDEAWDVKPEWRSFESYVYLVLVSY